MTNRSFASEQFFAKMTWIRFCEYMRHLLVLAELAWRQELLIAEIASEAGICTTMKFGTMHQQTTVRTQISNWRALKTHVLLKLQIRMVLSG